MIVPGEGGVSDGGSAGLGTLPGETGFGVTGFGTTLLGCGPLVVGLASPPGLAAGAAHAVIAMTTQTAPLEGERGACFWLFKTGLIRTREVRPITTVCGKRSRRHARFENRAQAERAGAQPAQRVVACRVVANPSNKMQAVSRLLIHGDTPREPSARYGYDRSVRFTKRQIRRRKRQHATADSARSCSAKSERAVNLQSFSPHQKFEQIARLDSGWQRHHSI